MQQAFYTVPQVAEILGIGETKTRQLITSGKIASIRLADSRIRRVPAKLLAKWIEEQTQEAENKQSG